MDVRLLESPHAMNAWEQAVRQMTQIAISKAKSMTTVTQTVATPIADSNGTSRTQQAP
jgi:hypothetical protein